MTVAVLTPDFVEWCHEQGYDPWAERCAPVLWGYMALYDKAREARTTHKRPEGVRRGDE